MKSNNLIKIKAALLLTVFALNTVIAFACALGLNLGYNNGHHSDKKTGPKKAGCHVEKTIDPHDFLSSSRNVNDDENKDEDCCSKNAGQFQEINKAHAYTAKIQIVPPVLTALDYVNKIRSVFTSLFVQKQYYYIPPDSPPIVNIRIAIQSFQI